VKKCTNSAKILPCCSHCFRAWIPRPRHS